MRLAWLTDIHLNFLLQMKAVDFLREVRAIEPDAVMIGGDIGEAQSIEHYLELLDDVLQLPIYFVLGNHDFYHGSIAGVRAAVESVCQARPRLRYLSSLPHPIELTPKVGLVGHDGWADGRLGDYERSVVQMCDWGLIDEFLGKNKQQRWGVVQSLGDEAAAHLRRTLQMTLDQYETAVVLTHIPPVHEACWHEGRLSDDHWAPHFTCKAVGDVLLDLAKMHPHRQIEVYCGHTHGHGKCRPLRNLRIYTGGAEYGQPHLQQLLEW
jgi:3',5'-cyclic AMP phosphodiesterase CpdA